MGAAHRNIAPRQEASWSIAAKWASSRPAISVTPGSPTGTAPVFVLAGGTDSATSFRVLADLCCRVPTQSRLDVVVSSTGLLTKTNNHQRVQTG